MNNCCKQNNCCKKNNYMKSKTYNGKSCWKGYNNIGDSICTKKCDISSDQV